MANGTIGTMNEEIYLEPMVDLDGNPSLMVMCSCDWYVVLRTSTSAGALIKVMTDHWETHHG